jgi:hypothetical protein
MHDRSYDFKAAGFDAARNLLACGPDVYESYVEFYVK